MGHSEGHTLTPTFHVELHHTPLLKHHEAQYLPDGTRADVPSAEHAVIESSGNKIIDKAESMVNAAVKTGTTAIQDYVHDTFNVPQTGGPDYLSTSVLLGAVVGYFALRRTLRKHMNEVRERVHNHDTLPRNDKRAVMSQALVKRGHASIDEILKASFGEWPPKGLDVYGQNTRQVEIKGIKTPNSKPWQLTKKWKDHNSADLGSATIFNQRAISVNKMLLGYLPALFRKSSYASTMGHEVTHILQADHDNPRSAETFGPDISRTIYMESMLPRSEQFVSNMPPEMFVPDPAEFLSEKAARQISYQRDGAEIQARLQEILADGYQRWGIMPQNREQFMVAMANTGLSIPDRFLSQLQSSPDFTEARALFIKDNAEPITGAFFINRTFETLTDEGKDFFWSEFMPRAYCDLIEMYGDKQGRERFGYGPNIRYQFNLHAAGEPNTVQEISDNLIERVAPILYQEAKPAVIETPKKTPTSFDR